MSHGKSGGNRPGSGGHFKKPPAKLGSKPKGKSKTAGFDFSDQPKHHGPRNNTPEPGARLHQRLGEFTISRISHDGRGLTEWQGKTLFVEGALPGETVSARFVMEHGRYAEAVVDEVITAAPERTAPLCSHYLLCGGCQLQHMSAQTQLDLKQNAVLEQLQRWAGLTPEQILPPLASPEGAYRSCARMGIWYEKDGSVTLGFRRRNSKTLTPIAACYVLPEKLNQLLAPLQQWLTHSHTAKAVTHVELLDSQNGGALVLRHTKSPGERDLQGLRELAQQHNCLIWLDDGSKTLQDLNGQPCDPRLSYYLPEFNLELGYHPQDFMQVNPAVNAQMIAQAIQLLAPKKNQRILDLFCGIGNFTLPLAQHCAEVFGVEAVDTMVERGRENATRADISNAKFMAADLTKLSAYQLQQRCGKIDGILLDPPRDGAKEIVAHIVELAAKRIVYVSCNPATLARDAKILADNGYKLKTLGVMDMFPHTHHVETMALFVRG
jgi:23S rRNA (uracil1939-C5)-methyltransferase